MIKCFECGEEKLQITWNHLRKHGLTTQSYRVKYPDAPFQDESIILRGEANPFFGRKHTDELKRWQHNHFTGKKQKPDVGQRISASLRDPNGLHRQAMNDPDYRQNMSNVIQAYWNSDKSNDHREKNSVAFKEQRKQLASQLKALRGTPEHRQKLSIGVKKMWAAMSRDDKRARIEKQVVSMMKNSTLTSKGEDALFSLLIERYSDTVRGVWFHPSQTRSEHVWNIDFYIPNIDTYVQFDGIYWHGLDRSIDEIKNARTKRGDAIYKKWLIDQEQNVWFAAVGKRLVRVTDIEFKNDPSECIRKIENIDVIPA